MPVPGVRYPQRHSQLRQQSPMLIAMTPEDEEFLTELYRNLNKQAVPPSSPQYVPLEEFRGRVMGPDAVKLLGRTITMTSGKAWSSSSNSLDHNRAVDSEKFQQVRRAFSDIPDVPPPHQWIFPDITTHHTAVGPARYRVLDADCGYSCPDNSSLHPERGKTVASGACRRRGGGGGSLRLRRSRTGWSRRCR